MIPIKDLEKISQARLQDAEVLFKAGRFDGAIYLCGYAVETSLKTTICKTLNWSEFPATRGEFEGLQSLKTHSLRILLRLSGAEENIKTRYLAEWSIVAAWDPEARYQLIGKTTKDEAKLMIKSAKVILREL